MKDCAKCGQSKPLDMFQISTRKRDGIPKHASYCKPCMTQYQRERLQANAAARESQRASKRRWDAAHPEAVRDYARQYYHLNLEHHREMAKAWRDRNPAKMAARSEARKKRGSSKTEGLNALYAHRLTLERRKRITADQQNACPICHEPLDMDNTGRQHVDHDHACCPSSRSCGVCIRGILCGSCNARLGWYENNRAAVADYLAKGYAP